MECVEPESTMATMVDSKMWNYNFMVSMEEMLMMAFREIRGGAASKLSKGGVSSILIRKIPFMGADLQVRLGEFLGAIVTSALLPFGSHLNCRQTPEAGPQGRRATSCRCHARCHR
jgi:hypothetical protein